VGGIREIHENRAESVVIDGDRVAIRWNAAYTFADGSRVRFDQVALQRWSGDRIVEETFFYDPTALAAA
jgi:ketosteroid isomerase-like protein